MWPTTETKKLEFEYVEKSISCPSAEIFFGIDETGTGEAIGPLVVIMAYVKIQEKLPSIKDCKKAANKDFKEVENLLEKQVLGYKGYLIQPKDIDNHNVKSLITEAQVRLTAGVKGKGEIDSHWQNEKKLKDLVSRNCAATLTVKNHLDANSSLVAAASIIAKNIRKSRLLDLEKKTGMKVGSGNLGDLITKRYIAAGMKAGLRNKWSLKSLT